jgi:hypothetical protein
VVRITCLTSLACSIVDRQNSSVFPSLDVFMEIINWLEKIEVPQDRREV